ncbi:MAG: lysophospholipase [Peptococcaceae bacterium]|jgi:alpha-beta hydrolase superfamily lysophospholipase|nr:lysophospholipase [Peptococcaceae bacterium]
MQNFEFAWKTADGLELYAQGWLPEIPLEAVICLVHGLGEYCGRYFRFAAYLTRAGCAVLAFDQRGCGKSQGLRGHIPSYEVALDDISHLLDEASQRFPDSPCFLYGHSLGGNLVINYVLRRFPPLAGIIATSPWLRLAFEPPAFKVRLGRIMNSVWPSFTQANCLDIQALCRDPEVVETYKQDPLVHNRISARLFTTAFNSGKWALEHAKEFKLPLLLMHGSADRITSPQASSQFAKEVPGDCTFKLWDGLYHEIHNEREHQDVLNFLVEWIKAHLS